jgi:hypothetical protein
MPYVPRAEVQERSDFCGKPRPLLAPGLSEWFGKQKSEDMGERGYNTTPSILVQRSGSGHRTTYDHRQDYSLVTLNYWLPLSRRCTARMGLDDCGRLRSTRLANAPDIGARLRTGWVVACPRRTLVEHAHSDKRDQTFRPLQRTLSRTWLSSSYTHGWKWT